MENIDLILIFFAYLSFYWSLWPGLPINILCMVYYGHYTRTTTKKTTILGLRGTTAFFLFYATVSITFLVGSQTDFWYGWPLGLALLAYGASYFLVHDIFIHQKVFKLFRNANNCMPKGYGAATQDAPQTFREKEEWGNVWNCYSAI